MSLEKPLSKTSNFQKMKKTILILFLANLALVGFSQETYTLSDESKLTIEGSSTLHDWTVAANTMEGSIEKEGDALETVDFSVAVADIHSDRAAAMDKKMHEALKKEEHPRVLFSVKGANVPKNENQELKGTLNVAGVEKEVAVPVTVTESGEDGLQISGEHKIVLQDYEIEPPTAMFGTIVVGDEVTVKFDLKFSK
jgi:polyisoprenoid-binding protein YceI